MGFINKMLNRGTKAQRLETKRRRALVKELYQVLLGCSSVQDMKSRVEVVFHQIDAVGAKKLEEYKGLLKEGTLGDLGVQAQEGKGKEIEQKIIDLFATEKLEIVQTLLGEYQAAHDGWCRIENLQRPPDTLKVGLLD